jgi:hypothetical protein
MVRRQPARRKITVSIIPENRADRDRRDTG